MNKKKRRTHGSDQSCGTLKVKFTYRATKKEGNFDTGEMVGVNVIIDYLPTILCASLRQCHPNGPIAFCPVRSLQAWSFLVGVKTKNIYRSRVYPSFPVCYQLIVDGRDRWVCFAVRAPKTCYRIWWATYLLLLSLQFFFILGGSKKNFFE